jgi:hypothetical protein
VFFGCGPASGLLSLHGHGDLQHVRPDLVKNATFFVANLQQNAPDLERLVLVSHRVRMLYLCAFPHHPHETHVIIQF